MAIFDPHTKPMVKSPWRLRNDGDYILAYQCVADELTWKVLSPLEASIITFLDGKTSYKKLQDIWVYFYGSRSTSNADCVKYLDLVLGCLGHTSIISTEGPASPSVRAHGMTSIPNLGKNSQTITRLNKPLSAALAITNRCTTNCIYCYAEKKKCKELSLSEWIKVFDHLREHSLYIVDIAGGDIFARADALDVLYEMIQREFVFFLSTKSYISPLMAEKLGGLGIGVSGVKPHLVRPLQISVDSAEDNVASFLVRRKDYLGRADASVKNLARVGIRPRIKCVLTQYNHKAPQALIEHFVDLGIENFQFVQYGRSHYRHSDDLFLTKPQKFALRNKFVQIKECYPGINITYQDDVSAGESVPPKSQKKWHERTLCSGGRLSMQIMTNGDVLLCDQLPHKKEFIVGNIVDQDLLDMWNGKLAMKFIYPPRENFKKTVCYTCPAFDECHKGLGYCYRESLFSYGSIFDAPPDCPRQKKLPVRQI